MAQLCLYIHSFTLCMGFSIFLKKKKNLVKMSLDLVKKNQNGKSRKYSIWVQERSAGKTGEELPFQPIFKYASTTCGSDPDSAETFTFQRPSGRWVSLRVLTACQSFYGHKCLNVFVGMDWRHGLDYFSRSLLAYRQIRRPKEINTKLKGPSIQKV